MLKIEKERGSEGLIVRLQGIMDGQVDFEKSIGIPTENLIVDCSRVNHMNSSGIKPWFTYFQLLAQKGVLFTFRAVSAAMIDYINQVPNILCGGQVESVVAPFFCNRCHRPFSVLLKTENMMRVTEALEAQQCPGCSHRLQFDEVGTRFFRFMR